MLLNTSNKIIYLESGGCKPGTKCEATQKEIISLLRQNGVVELVDSNPAPKRTPVVESTTPTTSTPVVTPRPPLQLYPPGTDEFGPMKDTDGWSELAPTQKMLITRSRNQKYGPQ